MKKQFLEILKVSLLIFVACSNNKITTMSAGEPATTRTRSQEVEVGTYRSFPFAGDAMVDISFAQTKDKVYAVWTEKSERGADLNSLWLSTSKDLVHWETPENISNAIPRSALSAGPWLVRDSQNRGVSVLLTLRKRDAYGFEMDLGYLHIKKLRTGRWEVDHLPLKAEKASRLRRMLDIQSKFRLSSGNYAVRFDADAKSYVIRDCKRHREYFLGLPRATVIALLTDANGKPVLACHPKANGDDVAVAFQNAGKIGMIQLSSKALRKDSDNDGLTDVYENFAGIDPQKADTDNDGISDAKDSDPMVDNHQPLSARDELFSAFLENYMGKDYYNPRALIRIQRKDGRRQWFPNHACRITWVSKRSKSNLSLDHANISGTVHGQVQYSVISNGIEADKDVMELQNHGENWSTSSMAQLNEINLENLLID